MIPAFSTFDPQMHVRLLNFFELSIIRPVLLNLKNLQGQKNYPVSLEICRHFLNLNLLFLNFTSTASDPFGDNNPPPVSIKIEEVQSDDLFLQASCSSGTGPIQSTNHPNQVPQIYHLAFIISPLLSAMFDSIDARNADGDLVIPSHLLRLLEVMTSSRPDLYNNLLEVIAFRGPKARQLAIACLANFWPRAIGHSTISAPFYRVSSSNIHSHQFSFWFFGKSTTGTDSDNSDNCQSCLKPIAGFCLRCPLCLTSVHSDCYDVPDGNAEVHYSMPDDSRLQRIAMYRFSHMRPNGGATQGIIIDGHHLLSTNWFTLCLCVVCQQPLWGIHNQGLRCERCFVPLHFHCLSLIGNRGNCGKFMVTSSDIALEWEALRRSCLNHFPFLLATREGFEKRSYEEILIYRDVLQTQLQILLYGIVMGSLVISNAETAGVPEFEMQGVIELCEQLLESGSLSCGPLTENYRQHTATPMSSAMYDRCHLEYVTASIKSPFPPTSAASPSLLTVNIPYDDLGESVQSFAYECVPLSHIRSALITEFAMHSDDVAYFFISQLQQHAFLDRKDCSLRPFINLAEEYNVECIFPLPLGIDLSLNVEILVSAIESCLEDLDLTTNEFGFLLLTRRFWPNGLASEQGLTRLASRVFAWILDEVRYMISHD